MKLLHLVIGRSCCCGIFEDVNSRYRHEDTGSLSLTDLTLMSTEPRKILSESSNRGKHTTSLLFSVTDCLSCVYTRDIVISGFWMDHRQLCLSKQIVA